MRLDLAHHKVYPVVLKEDNYNATNNGKGYCTVIFLNGQFWWQDESGDRIVMPVRQFHGYPVVYSNGYYWGSENGRDYFAVGFSNGHYYRMQHMNLLMRLHLSHGTVYPEVSTRGNCYETNNDHVYPVV